MNLTAGEIIKETRKQAGLTQKQLSEKYAIPLSTLKDWELELHKCPTYVANLLVDRIALDYPKQAPKSSINRFAYPDLKEVTHEKEDLYYMWELISALCESLEYIGANDKSKMIDDFCKAEFDMSSDEILEIKDYLVQEYGTEWSYENYRKVMLIYIYNTYKYDL